MSETFCVMPRCERPPATQLSEPICSHHARKVYAEVADLLASAGIDQHVASARPPRQASAMRNRADQAGLVYFARVGEHIKIGFTTNLPQRMRQLGGQVLATMPGTRRDEKRMQMRFADHWVDGEYYRPAPALLEHIAGIA